MSPRAIFGVSFSVGKARQRRAADAEISAGALAECRTPHYFVRLLCLTLALPLVLRATSSRDESAISRWKESVIPRDCMTGPPTKLLRFSMRSRAPDRASAPGPARTSWVDAFGCGFMSGSHHWLRCCERYSHGMSKWPDQILTWLCRAAS
jgi:hypothetical protein